MNLVKYSSASTYLENHEIKNAIVDFWENDVWYGNDSHFNEFRRTVDDKTYRKIDFSKLPEMFKNELKFFFMQRIKNQENRLGQTIFNIYGKCLKRLSSFLHIYYSQIDSFVDIEPNKARIQLRTYLISQGLKINPHKLTHYENLLSQLCHYYNNFYDTRDEFEKDIWDFRKIPGSRITPHESQHILDFRDIPVQFRNLIKRYMKVRIASCSHGQCNADVRMLRSFLNYINRENSGWHDLNSLSRRDMEGFLSWYRYNSAGNEQTQRTYLICLRIFLDYIQRAEYKEAPDKPVNLLMFREDLPKSLVKSENEIKYIPEGVIQQLEDNLAFLRPPEYIPIVILLRATGWRISDILNLKYTDCLTQTAQWMVPVWGYSKNSSIKSPCTYYA